MAPKTPHLEYIVPIESACQRLDHQGAEEHIADVNRELRRSHTAKPNLTKEEMKVLAELRKDSIRIVLPVDNGVAMVTMDRKDNIEKATNLFAQPAYRTINGDLTNKLKAKLITLLGEIKRKTGLEDNHYRYMYPMGCNSPKFYGLPKIHKSNIP